MDRIPVEEYAELVRALLAPVLERPTLAVATVDALGRVTAVPVVTTMDLPPFRNSQMDGYAVRAADIAATPAVLPVSASVAAGTAAPALPAGQVVKVMTGAPLPAGADAVVPVEDTAADGDGRVRIMRSRAAGEYVRERGSDLAAGSELLPDGLRLRPRHLGAIAAAGIAAVRVRTKVRVGVLSTGLELAEPGARLTVGQIPDANSAALAAAVQEAGADVVSLARVGDDVAALEAALDQAIASGAEVLITSGGISMGDHEPVRTLLSRIGGAIGTVEMQPGGPQANSRFRDVPLVAFPGNPVSSQLSFALFVAPLLREVAGLPPARTQRLPLATAIDVPPGRRRFLRARRTGDGTVAVLAGTGSHLVAALASADLLVDVGPEVGRLPEGSLVTTVEL